MAFLPASWLFILFSFADETTPITGYYMKAHHIMNTLLLTHLSLDKMAAICKQHFQVHFHWCQAITWTGADAIHWRIYTALGGDELTQGDV